MHARSRVVFSKRLCVRLKRADGGVAEWLKAHRSPTGDRLSKRLCVRLKRADGGVAEWLKAHAWKVCIRETVSRVRIPLPPPINCHRATSKLSDGSEETAALLSRYRAAPLPSLRQFRERCLHLRDLFFLRNDDCLCKFLHGRVRPVLKFNLCHIDGALVMRDHHCNEILVSIAAA